LTKTLSIITILILTSLVTGCTTNNSDDNDSSDTGYSEIFSFNLLNGGKKITSDYEGKIVLLDFTGVTCPWCVPQTFALEAIYNNYSSDDLVIISIYVWMFRETVEDINNLLDAYSCVSPCDAEEDFTQISLRDYKQYNGKQNGMKLKWVIGYDDSEGTLYYKYGQNGIPYILILDKNGNIYYSNPGYTDYNSITEKLDELIV